MVKNMRRPNHVAKHHKALKDVPKTLSEKIRHKGNMFKFWTSTERGKSKYLGPSRFSAVSVDKRPIHQAQQLFVDCPQILKEFTVE